MSRAKMSAQGFPSRLAENVGCGFGKITKEGSRRGGMTPQVLLWWIPETGLFGGTLGVW